ncbi:hypothetical protein JCM11491_003789 [Sporobolomyces phaffii]
MGARASRHSLGSPRSSSVNHPRDSPTVASTNSQPQPGGGGLKLKLTLGGHSAAAPPHPPPVHPPNPPNQYWQQPATAPPPPRDDDRDRDDDDSDARRVSPDKYRRLKKKYLAAVDARDEASLSLLRAQKLIHRLRGDKSSLLDRVLDLEIAAGITSADVLATTETELRTERELQFPLLNPPDLPSLDDRARPLPVLTTSTDFTNSNYNAPVGPAPLPKTFPPRQRSHHLQTAVAAQRLRDDYDAKLAAQGLQRAAFPAVAALGLEGSAIALTVERALAGEPLDTVAGYEPHAHGHAPARANKRRRQSTATTGGGGGGGGGKPRSMSNSIHVPQEQPSLQYLPNPFAAVGAVPEGSVMARNSAEALAAAQAAAAAEMQQQLQHNPYEIPGVAGVAPANEYDLDDGGGGGDGASSDEEEDYKPNIADGIAGGPGARRAGRQSTGPERGSKSKRGKGSVLGPGVHAIPHVPRNADGTPRLPLAAGIMTLNNLGVVNAQEGFHTERYIFPVGYEAVRRYPSMVNKTAETEYVCRIVDSGQGGPMFELHPADQPGTVIQAATPTGAWSQVVKAANKLRERNHSNSVSGPDYFGLSHVLVKALIQELPGATALPAYMMQTFVEDLAPVSASAKGKKGKKSGRRKSKLGGGGGGGAGDEGEDAYSAAYGIDVDDAGAAYDTSGYGNGIAEAFTREGSYDSGSYPASASPEDTTGGPGGAYHPETDYSNPASLANLLQGGGGGGGGGGQGVTDPYALPTFASNAPSAPYDPYAIPPAQPAFDPSFGGAYNASASFGAYDLPGGQAYASSEASSP